MWNRCYEPWRISRDKKIKEQLKQREEWAAIAPVQPTKLLMQISHVKHQPRWAVQANLQLLPYN